MIDVAAVDVGGTRIKAAVVRSDGHETYSCTVPTPADLRDHLGSTIAQIVHRLTESTGALPRAVGVAAPGLVDDHRATGVFSANLGWQDLDLRRPVEDAVDLPVAIGHDVRAGLLAESWLGAARGHRDALFVPIGTGIAAAVRVDGRDLVAGGYAGEIGHVVVDPGGAPCGCGARGCLEAVASAGAIGRRYAALSGDAPDQVDAQTVATRAAQGETLARAVWDEAVDRIARVLAVTTAVTGVRLVVVGGGLVNAGHLLLDPLQEGLARYGGSLRVPQVVPALLGDRAGCLGAARLALDLVERS